MFPRHQHDIVPWRLHRHRCRRRQTAGCRGSIYLTVLGSSLIVTVIGLSALAAVRVQRQADEANHDLAQARLLARSATELGMLQMHDDPRWRHRGEGVWIDSLAMGDGAISLEVWDPSEADFADPEGPAVLIGEGQVGLARYRVQTQVRTTRGLGALESALHVGDDITIDGATVACDQAITANDDISAKDGATVFGDVEAGDHVDGGTYMGQTMAHADEREMPDRDAVLAYYTAKATRINYADLTSTGPNLLENSAMDSAVAPWDAQGAASLNVSSSSPHSGAGSLRVTGRAAWWAGPMQEIGDHVTDGADYDIETWVRMGSYGDFMNIIVWVRDDDGDHWISTSWSNVGTAWTRVTARLRIQWKGSLQLCKVYLATAGSTQDYFMDDFTMREVDVDGPGMRRVVLSPASNPLGAGQTNADGIYLLDCDGRDVEIQDVRVVGTLIVDDPGSGSKISGAVHFEPVYENYPVLLVRGGLKIAFGDGGLSEADLGVNFNPAQTPFPFNLGVGGESDGDTDDAYKSVIQGLVYASDGLEFEQQPTIDGVVIAHDDVVVDGGNLTLRYRSVYLNDPPPAFDTAERNIEFVAGSWRRIVD